MPTAAQVLVGLLIFFFILWLPLVGGFLMRKLCDYEERSRDRGGLGSR
jgi:hypothetical protein